MSTSLVHLGDFHAAPDPRNAERYAALDQAIAAGLALPRLGAWLWPGDLNHARMSIADRNALAARLCLMAAAAPVVICYGNHDLPGDLDVFAMLGTVHPIYVIDRPGCTTVRLATREHATIFVLRYPTKAGLTSMGIAPDDVIDAAADALDAIFLQAASELETARARGDLTCMIGHVNVGGAVVSCGQPNIGREIELSPRHLDRLGAIYKGLNHIHKGQEIFSAWYPGSICRLDWGEIEEKRWIEVRYEYDDASQHANRQWAYTVHSHAIDIAPMYHVEGELTRDDFIWHVTAGPGGAPQQPPQSECRACGGSGDGLKDPVEGTLPCESCQGFGFRVDWTRCAVRVRYSFKQSEKSVVDENLVRQVFAGAARLELEPIAVPDRALRAPAVAQARTLAEKLQAWAEIAGVSTSERVLEKLGQLEHRDPLQLLSAIQTDLAALEKTEEATVAA